MKFFFVLIGVLFIILLTAITQIGGIVFLISLLFHGLINRKLNSIWAKVLAKSAVFLMLYLIFTFFIVPVTAKYFGRVPLPVFEQRNVKPANMLTCFLNRHYVKPALQHTTYRVADQMAKKYPGTKLNYLDANFPFIDNFPLLPHLSHNDGKKLDLSFQYNDRYTGKPHNDVPSFIGYGIFEEPGKGEDNKPEHCAKNGYWQYNILREVVAQDNKDNFVFNQKRTKDLINAFATDDAIGKIFIEPHLKTRLKLKHNKIRFHGCQAVRHDDHIHIQLK